MVARGGPISLVRSCGARSPRIVQRFVEALDFNAVEPLVPNLQPSAEGFRCAQVLDGVTERLGRRRETAILRAANVVWAKFAAMAEGARIASKRFWS